MAQKQYEYDGIIRELPDNGGAYVLFPWDVREEFGKGRVRSPSRDHRSRVVSHSIILRGIPETNDGKSTTGRFRVTWRSA